MLDLTFTPEQEMLRESTRALLEVGCPSAIVRDLEDNPDGYPFGLWKMMGELDLIGLMLPEAFGGSGQTLLEGIVLYSELGRALAPVPHLESAVVAGGLLTSAGSDDQLETWLPKISSGDAIMTIAWHEPSGGYAPSGITTRATETDSGFTISGTKRHVTYARAADQLVVVARSGDDEREIDLFLVSPSASGVTMTQQFSLASDTQYEVRFDNVTVDGAARIGPPNSGWTSLSKVLQTVFVLTAAEATGGARRSLEMAVDYAKAREQFGKPIGSFQAIAHYLADAITNVDGADQLVNEAAWAAAVGHRVDRLAPMAKLFSCSTYRDVTAMAQQVFGGIGFTLDVDIQLYFRRAKQLQLNWGDTAFLQDAIAAAVLD